MMEQPDVSRVRTQWDCDGENLLINVRDDGRGALAADAPSIMRLDRRVEALTGTLQVDVMPGWGADVFVTLPLDPPARLAGDVAGWNLAARELEVLQYLVAGQRNYGQVPCAEPVQKARSRLTHRGHRLGTQPRTPMTVQQHGDNGRRS